MNRALMCRMVKLFQIFISFLLIIYSSATLHAGVKEEMLSVEEELLVLINDARMNPLETVRSLGIDPDQLIIDLPDFAMYSQQGMQPLEFNAYLNDSASLHSLDMTTNGYYSKLSVDGTTPEERIQSTGYSAELYGETLGMLTFINFIDPKLAVRHIFQRMVMDELNPEYEGQRNIFNPNIDSIGIGIGTGALITTKARYNYYIVTCDFSGNRNSVLEKELFNLINQARVNPLSVLVASGFEPIDVISKLPAIENYLFTGLPPLALNEKLTLASSSTVDNQDILDQLSNLDYDPVNASCIRFKLRFEKTTDPGTIVNSIFQTILMNEFTSNIDDRIIFNENFEDLGLNLSLYDIKEGDIERLECSVIVSASINRLPQMPKIIGVIYNDKNMDGLYSTGEGIAEVNVLFINEDISYLTNETGGFQIPFEPGIYNIIITGADQEIQKQIDLDFVNKGVYLEIDTQEDILETTSIE